MSTVIATDTDAFIVKSYDSDERWLSARSYGIGASEVPAVLGLSPWKSPFALWSEKLGIKTEPREQERLYWGRELEAVIVRRYAEETGRQLEDLGRRTVLISTRWPILCCTLDRRIVGDPRGLGVCEVKNVSEFVGDEWDEEPPLMYQAQGQAQLAVTGYTWGALVALIGGNRLVHYDFERNDAFIGAMAERCAEFWARVERREPPDVDASDATAAALAALYPHETGATVMLPDDAAEWDAKRQDAMEQIKKYEEIKEECSNWIKAAIGEAAVGIIRGGAKYTWKTVNRKEYVVRASSFRQLRRSA